MNNFKRAIFNISGTTVYFLVQLVVSILITKVIGFESGGVNTLALTISNVFYPIALYGVRGFQVSDIKNEFSEGDYIYLRIVTTTTAVLFFVVALLFLQLPVIAIVCSVSYMVIRVFESFSDLFFGVYQKKDKFNYIFYSYTFKSMSVLIIFIITIFLTHNVFIIISTQIAAFAIVFILYDIKKFRQLSKFKIDTGNLLTLIKKCLPLMLFSFVSPYINFIVRYFIQLIYGTTILGFYSAIAIFQSVMSMLTSCIWIIYIPLFADLYYKANARQIQIIIAKIMGGILAISVIAVATVIFFGDSLLALVYGKDILSYSYLLIPILLISLIVSVVMLFNTILISIGKNNIMLYANVAGAVIITICAYPLILNYGLTGANIAIIIGVILQAILVIFITFRAIRKNDGVLIIEKEGD